MDKGTSHQEIKAAMTLENIKRQNIDYSDYSKEFVREKGIRLSSIIWYSLLLAFVIVTLSLASGAKYFLFALLLIPLVVALMYWKKKTENRKQEEFMKQHFMKQGDPRYWGRAGNERNNESSF